MSINGESSTLVLLFLGVGVDNCKDAACLKNRKEHLDAAGKILFGQIKPKLCCLGGKKNTHTHTMGKRHSTPTSKPHLSCEVWWTGHHGLEIFCCFGTWTACYQ